MAARSILCDLLEPARGSLRVAGSSRSMCSGLVMHKSKRTRCHKMSITQTRPWTLRSVGAVAESSGGVRTRTNPYGFEGPRPVWSVWEKRSCVFQKTTGSSKPTARPTTTSRITEPAWHHSAGLLLKEARAWEMSQTDGTTRTLRGLVSTEGRAAATPTGVWNLANWPTFLR